MADYGFGDPNAAMATNPYLQPQQAPDWRQVLGNALLGVGAGISQADSSGRGWGQGIGPGLMMGNQMTQQQEQQLFQRQLHAAQWQQMEAYRRAQEENMRSQVAEREMGMNIDRGILGQINGGGGQTAAPPGMGYQPPPAQMGPNQFNVGNVRPVGSNAGFQQPASFDDGVAMSVRNARAYPAAFNNGQPMTLMQIGERWAPKGDGANDPAQWARNVASIGGLAPNQPLDMNDPATAAKFARGVHGAEWGQGMLKPPEAYAPGANMAGSPRVIRVADGPQAQPQGQPQQALNLPPGASTGLDPLSQQMLLSKRFGPLGQARITNQNQQRTQALEEQKFLEQQRANAEKQALDTANAKVNPATMQPNKALNDAETQTAAAKAEAEARVKLENEAALKLSADEMARYSKEIRPGVEATMKSLPNLYEMKRLTEGPLASGSFIDARQTGARILDTLGIQPMSDGMVNRTEFNNRAGKSVLAILQTKALGSGTGISSTDREFVQKMAGQGEYTTEEVKKLNEIAIKSAQTEIKQHNEDIVPRLQKLAGVGKIDKSYFDIAAQGYDQWAKDNPAVASMSSPSASAMPAGASPAPVTPAASIPRAAIKHLMMNPKLVDEFELKYGPGTAGPILRGAK
jgi:hypothetical protein